jgi:PAS domain-containing protein
MQGKVVQSGTKQDVQGGRGMARMNLELDADLYQMLQQSAQANQLTIEEECRRRLEGGERRSCYMQALVAELRADDEQRRAAGQ